MIILQYFDVRKAITKKQLVDNFSNKIVVKVSDHIPRILNWKTKKDFPRIKYFAKGMFRDDNNSVCTV
ncbi:hypothetical protein MTR67_035514 [Solanum verrucosum]|uniref:Uncharacterized protein n=1 Tax=Solanum verrucosum TaxID=315347 RepID=A0AAF0UAB0_SOLVR|nr:hypothetical protein MTR67_035514 [Solanum verrucosum]